LSRTVHVTVRLAELASDNSVGPHALQYKYAPHNDVSVNDGGTVRL